MTDNSQLSDPELIAAYASRKATDAGLNADAVVQALKMESGLNPRAVGDNGQAVGIGQLHPGAALDAGIAADQRYDPQTNIDAAVTRLAKLRDQFGGDEIAAHGAYMMGEKGFREALAGGGQLPPQVRERLKAVSGILNGKTQAAPAAEPSQEPAIDKAAAADLTNRWAAPGSLNGLPSPLDVGKGLVRGMIHTGAQAAGGLVDMASGKAPSAQEAAAMLQAGTLAMPAEWPIAAGLAMGGSDLLDTFGQRRDDLRAAGKPAGMLDVLKTFSPADYVRAGTTALITHALGSMVKPAEGPAGAAMPAPPAPLPPPDFIPTASPKELGTRLLRWKPELLQEAEAQLAARPSPGQMRVAKAYAAIDPGGIVNANDYAERILEYKQAGKSLPPEVEAHLEPVLDAHGKPTGDYTANVGDVLGMLQDLGRDIWTSYKGGSTSSSVGDMIHLQRDLGDMLKQELSPSEAKLLESAQKAALNQNNDSRTIKAVLRYVNPDTGYLNSKALDNFFQSSAGAKLKKFGAEDFQVMQDGAKYIAQIQSEDEAAHKAIQEAWKAASKAQEQAYQAQVAQATAKPPGPSTATRTAAGGAGYVFGHMAANAIGVPPWIGGGLGARLGYSAAGDAAAIAHSAYQTITSPQLVRLLGGLASTSIGTTDHAEALGRVLAGIKIEAAQAVPPGTEVAPPESTPAPGASRPNFAAPPPR